MRVLCGNGDIFVLRPIAIGQAQYKICDFWFLVFDFVQKQLNSQHN
jgi:hypothetical protein